MSLGFGPAAEKTGLCAVANFHMALLQKLFSLFSCLIICKMSDLNSVEIVVTYDVFNRLENVSFRMTHPLDCTDLEIAMN